MIAAGARREGPGNSDAAMRGRAPGRLAEALVALLVAVSPLSAYTIVLRDGSTVQAQSPYRVEGERAVITLQNGTQTFLSLSEIDVERTAAANRDGTAAERPRITLAGNLDFATLPRLPYADARVVQLLSRHFRGQRLAALEVSSGSQAGHVLLSLTVGSEGEVFRAIGLAATALGALAEAGHHEVQAIELLMLTSRGGDAGQFLLTPDLVRPLVAGEIEISDFYVQNVRF